MNVCLERGKAKMTNLVQKGCEVYALQVGNYDL